MLRSFVIMIALGALAGCGAAPPGRAERGLYEDLRRVVEHRERAGDWVIDRYAIEAAADTSLASACRTTPETRQALDAWLATRIAQLGGPAADAYVRRGRDVGEVEEIRFYERVRMLVRLGMERGTTECPFWVEVEPDFGGIQGTASGTHILVESVGSGALLFKDGEWALGGFGGAHVLPALAIGESVQLAFGPELGAVGSFPTDPDGDRQLVAKFSLGVPLLLRIHDGTQHFDFEVAVSNRFTENEFPFAPSVRLSAGYGLSSIRSGGVLPIGGLWLGWEVTPGRDGESTEHAVQLGTRVGFDWHP